MRVANPSAGADSCAAAQFTAELRAVASGGVPVNEFFGYFMSRVPAWDQQDELQRRSTCCFSTTGTGK